MKKDMPRFNFEKYGPDYGTRGFVIEPSSEQELIDGIVTTGCPFAFVID